MNRFEDIDMTIFEYLDGTLSPSGRHAFEQELATNREAKKRFDELKSVHIMMKSGITEQPSKNFTPVVMGNLSGRSFYQKLSIMNSILLLVGIMVVTGLCAFFVSNGFFDSTTTVDINSISPVNNYIEKYSDKSVPVLNINGKFIVNVIILLNLGLAFMILDRAVLKPLFQKRRSQASPL